MIIKFLQRNCKAKFCNNRNIWLLYKKKNPLTNMRLKKMIKDLLEEEL